MRELTDRQPDPIFRWRKCTLTPVSSDPSFLYTAELLFSHPNCTKEFARIFNETFLLFKDNVGTFGHILSKDDERYDVILSNPPYVTSGSSIIKEELQSKAETRDAYPINSLGLEGLSIEWIVNSLRPGGRAFVIIPDGILGRVNGGKLRAFILKNCYLDAIVTLPPRTFFSNAELTYVLAITKKSAVNGLLPAQTDPVFTYLVSNIGERLTSVRREEIPENDLPEMEKLFKVFLASKGTTKGMLEKESGRCKIQDFDTFSKTGSHWVVDRWWNKSELVSLGVEKEFAPVTQSELSSALVKFQKDVVEFQKLYDASISSGNMQSVALGRTDLFNLSIGERVLKKELASGLGEVPVFSSNVTEPFGKVVHTTFKSYDEPTIIWGIDGNFDFALKAEGYEFSITDHCGALRFTSDLISPEYLLYALRHRAVVESFNRSFRASLTNMRAFKIEIPINESGKFDFAEQKRLAVQYAKIDKGLMKLRESKIKLDDLFKRFTAPMAFLA